jgi:hypothetical protein
LCASPCVLDQSFPRSHHELKAIAITLGDIEQLVRENIVHLILPDSLADFLIEIDWSDRNGQYSLLLDIRRLLEQWFLQPHGRLVRIDTSNIQQYNPHPLPDGAEELGWTTLWAKELGKLLVLHDKNCCPSFSIGIACEKAFSSGTPGIWKNPDHIRCFPLVGPTEISELEDAYDWEALPQDVGQKTLSLDTALRNVQLLGATQVDLPHRDSHYKIHFPGARPWVLDTNVDPVPDRFIRELVDIVHLPVEIIRTTLIFGYFPRRNVLRLSL